MAKGHDWEGWAFATAHLELVYISKTSLIAVSPRSHNTEKFNGLERYTKNYRTVGDFRLR